MNPAILSIIRAAFKVGGGYLIARGLATDTEIETLLASLMAIVAVVWGILDRSHTPPPTGASPARTVLPVLIAIIGVASCGCARTNISELVKAAATDPAAVHISVMSPYASIVIDRANPGTNQISVSNNGITTKP